MKRNSIPPSRRTEVSRLMPNRNRAAAGPGLGGFAILGGERTVRKLRLTSMQRDILWMLEEAGEEELSCVRATLGHPDEADFERQVGALERIGLIARSVERGFNLPCLVLTPDGRTALTR